MADVTLPQLGETVTEGTITQWFKAVGDTVAVDEPLFEVSTDKVDSEVPSPASGVLLEIRVPEGETVDVGTVLAIVGDAGEAPISAPGGEPSDDAAEGSDAVESSAVAATTTGETPPTTTVTEPETSRGNDADPVLLSPLVRKLVNDHGLDPTTMHGSGIGGRITRSDVEAEMSAAPPRTAPSEKPLASPVAPTAHRAPRPSGPSQAQDSVEPFNTMRRITAEHMVYSKAVAPHVLMTCEVDYEAVERVRKRHGETFKAQEGFGLNYLPFIVLATVDALREFPRVNASVGDDALIIHHDINLGIAVDLNHEGLIVPVIHAADGLRLRAIAREIHALADRARTGNLTADDVTGGTFTLSNPGPFGTHFTGAIIAQPEVAILSTDGVSRKPVVVTAHDGTEAIAIHSVGLLAFSFDHRAFDGAYAAAFLARIKENLQTRDFEVELA